MIREVTESGTSSGFVALLTFSGRTFFSLANFFLASNTETDFASVFFMQFAMEKTFNRSKIDSVDAENDQLKVRAS